MKNGLYYDLVYNRWSLNIIDDNSKIRSDKNQCTYINITLRTHKSIIIRHYTLDQEVHKQFYWRIITDKMPISTVIFILWRVDPWLQVPLLPLTIVLPSLVKVRTRNPIVHDLLCILHWGSEQLCQVLVLRVLVQFLFPPTLYALSVPNQHVEETVQKQYNLILQLFKVQLNWCWGWFLDCVL